MACSGHEDYELQSFIIEIDYEHLYYSQFQEFDSIYMPYDVTVELAMANYSEDDISIDRIENEYSIFWCIDQDSVMLKGIGWNGLEFRKNKIDTHYLRVEYPDSRQLASVLKTKDLFESIKKIQSKSRVTIIRMANPL